MPGSFLLLLCLSVFFVFDFCWTILLRPEGNMGGEKNTNGCMNQIDEEHSRRESIVLPINRLKIDVPVRLSHDTLEIGHRSIHPFWFFSVSYLGHAKIKSWYIHLNIVFRKKLDTIFNHVL